jgi:hypothetical protein
MKKQQPNKAMFTTVKYRHINALPIPLQISGLLMWYKADSLGLNDGDSIATWADSGTRGANATQTIAGSKPIYKTNIINGKPVVRFDGTDDYLNITSASFTGSTIFVVGNPSGSASSISWPPIVMKSGSLADYQGNGMLYGVATDLSVGVIECFWNGGEYTNPPATSLTSPTLVTIYNEATGSNTNQSVRKNGDSLINLSNVSIAPSLNPTAGAIGARMQPNVGAPYLKGDIAELIVYGGYVGDTDRNRIEAYLNGKYNLY